MLTVCGLIIKGEGMATVASEVPRKVKFPTASLLRRLIFQTKKEENIKEVFSR